VKAQPAQNVLRALVEITAGIEPVQDGRIYIEQVNAAFMRQHGGKVRPDKGLEIVVRRPCSRPKQEKQGREGYGD
jgi:hypothetical protein